METLKIGDEFIICGMRHKVCENPELYLRNCDDKRSNSAVLPKLGIEDRKKWAKSLGLEPCLENLGWDDDDHSFPEFNNLEELTIAVEDLLRRDGKTDLFRVGKKERTRVAFE